MPAWNVEGTLGRAMTSVQAQTLQSWELLVIDDASGDDTGRIGADVAARDDRVRVLTQAQRSGAAQARNRGIRAARGRFIAFLDADDEWLPGKLEQQLAFMAERKAALSYTEFWRDTGTRRSRVAVPARVSHRDLLHGNVIGCLTAVYDRQMLGTVEMPDLRLRQDYALWLEILRRIPQAHGLQMPLAVHHQHAGSLSSNRWRAMRATWTLYRREGLGRLAAARCLASHLLRRVLRG